MPVNFTATNQAVSVKAQDIITSALIETGRTSPGESIDAAVMGYGLEKLQRLIDQLNATRQAIFSRTFQQFTLIANHAPHTIGPTGDFQIPIRPVRIVSASFILNNASANPVDSPQIRIRDDAWWASNPVKSQSNSIVTDLYYDPSLLNGTLNFWPVCNISNPVRLEFWNSLAQAIDLATTPLGMVQGYWEYLITTLAMLMCSGLQTTPSPVLVEAQKRAEKIAFANNTAPARIDTSMGLPHSGSGGPPDFNFLTGLRE